MSKEILAISIVSNKKLLPADIFKNGQLDPILEAIKSEVDKFTPDLSTANSRKEIAAMAQKVARSKTFLDDLGKGLVADEKAKLKLVDQERKRMRDFCDKLKADVRAPLTEYEEKEKARVDKHAENLNLIAITGETCKSDWMYLDFDVLNSYLLDVGSVIIDDSWQEFKTEVEIVKAAALANIRQAITERRVQDEKNAELEQLRADAEAREEAEKKAKAEADQKAREEAAAAAAAKAERDKIEAEAAKKKADEEAMEKQLKARANHAAHRARIEREALESFQEFAKNYPTPTLCVVDVLKAIKDGKIKHITLNY